MNIVSMDQKSVHDKPYNDLRWAAVRDFFQKQGGLAADRGDADAKADRANPREIEDILATALTSNRDNGGDGGGNTRRKPSRHHRGSSMLCPREIEQLRGSAEEKHIPANLDLSLDVSNHSTVSEVTWMTYRDENAKEELYRQISERMARAKRHLEMKRPDASAARGQAEATSDEKTAVVRGAGHNGASLTRKLSGRASRRFSNSDPGGAQRGFDLDDIYGQDEKEKPIPPLSRMLEKKEGKKPPTMTLDQMLHLKQFDQLKKSNLQLPMKQSANVEIATSSPTQGKMGRSDDRKSPERIGNLKSMEEPFAVLKSCLYDKSHVEPDVPSQAPTQPSTPPKSKHISYREPSLNPAIFAKQLGVPQLGVPHDIHANNIEFLGNISSITEANNPSFNDLKNIKQNNHSSTDLSARIHEIIDLKLQIANQQETIDRLSSNLNRADKKNDGLNNQLVEGKLMRAQLGQNVEDSNMDPRGEVSSRNSTPRASLLIGSKNNSCHEIIVQEGVGNNDSNSSSNQEMNVLLTKNMELTSENAQLKQEVHDLRKEFQLLLWCIGETPKHDAGAWKKLQEAAERGRQALGGCDSNVQLSTSMREVSEKSGHSRSSVPVLSTSTFSSSNYKKNKNNVKMGGDSELDDSTKMKMVGAVPGNNTPNESGSENGSSCDENDDHIIPTYKVANANNSCSRRLSLPEKMESFKCNIISSGVTHALQGWVSSRSEDKQKRIGPSEEESYCGNEEDLFQERVPVRETYSRMKSIRANLMQECEGYKPQSAPGMTIYDDVAGDGCDTKGWISRRCSA